MATDTNEMRMTTTTGDLLQWEDFFKEIASRELITIVQISEPYPNRNSILHRQFYQVKFNGKIR